MELRGSKEELFDFMRKTQWLCGGLPSKPSVAVDNPWKTVKNFNSFSLSSIPLEEEIIPSNVLLRNKGHIHTAVNVYNYYNDQPLTFSIIQVEVTIVIAVRIVNTKWAS